MLDLAGAIDFTATESDGFDQARFRELRDSLPSHLSALSELWVRWFLGQGGGTESYRVNHKIFSIPETLAKPHVYRRGESVDLTEGQVTDLFSTRGHDPGIIAVDPTWKPPEPEPAESDGRPDPAQLRQGQIGEQSAAVGGQRGRRTAIVTVPTTPA
jgi:hypothetical protein